MKCSVKRPAAPAMSLEDDAGLVDLREPALRLVYSDLHLDTGQHLRHQRIPFHADLLSRHDVGSRSRDVTRNTAQHIF